MANGNRVDELDNQIETDDFGTDETDAFADDEFDDDDGEGLGGGIDASDAELTETGYEGAVHANPKRLSASQRKKAQAIIEGLIDDADLEDEKGQGKAWQILNDKFGDTMPTKFDISAAFTENDVVDHPRFGVGFVVELINPKKINVLFEDGLRKLACNVE